MNAADVVWWQLFYISDHSFFSPFPLLSSFTSSWLCIPIEESSFDEAVQYKWE